MMGDEALERRVAELGLRQLGKLLHLGKHSGDLLFHFDGDLHELSLHFIVFAHRWAEDTPMAGWLNQKKNLIACREADPSRRRTLPLAGIRARRPL